MNAPLEPGAARLMDEVQQWTRALAERGLADATAIAELERVVRESRGERLDAPVDPFLVVMICGPTAVGKSTLINALANGTISRTGDGVTTAAPVIYLHERDDPTRLFEYSKALGERARDAERVVRHRRDELLNIVLVDTPDIDGVRERHHEIVTEMLPCADLILFVTSPERYKVMQAASWIRDVRQQRAVAFVMNKWDAPSFGLGWDGREDVDKDFRAVLAAENFSHPLVFRVSALEAASADERSPDNQLFALRAWLGHGLTRSTAVAIQQRRRRAAWARLRAVIARALPRSLRDQPLLGEWSKRAAQAHDEAKRLLRAEALSLPLGPLERSPRPKTYGLLGATTRTVERISGVSLLIRSVFSWSKAAEALQPLLAGAVDPSVASFAFGRSVPPLLADLTARFLRDAELARLPLGPVPTEWAAETDQLTQRLRYVVAEAEAQLRAADMRARLRRWLGIGTLYLFELLIAAVLLITLWRLAEGFATAQYTSSALIYNAIALAAILLLIGYHVGGLFFPAAADRMRRLIVERADAVADQTWRQLEAALSAQIEASAKLEQQGERMLSEIDRLVRAIAVSSPGDDEVSRLFGEAVSSPVFEPATAAPGAPAAQAAEPARRFALE